MRPPSSVRSETSPQDALRTTSVSTLFDSTPMPPQALPMPQLPHAGEVK
jgi:hypothetical protein